MRAQRLIRLKLLQEDYQPREKEKKNKAAILDVSSVLNQKRNQSFSQVNSVPEIEEEKEKNNFLYFNICTLKNKKTVRQQIFIIYVIESTDSKYNLWVRL